MKYQRVEFVLSAPSLQHCPPADFPEVAFAGRSNVGKSSLLNTLLNRRGMAKVSRTPGRTQLINYFLVNDQCFFVDLPGYGYAAVPESVRRAWRPMIGTYLQQRTTLCGLVLLLDIRRQPSPEDHMMFAVLSERQLPALLVLTKADKLSRTQRFSRTQAIGKALGIDAGALLPFSATTGLGREEVWEAIDALLAIQTQQRASSDEVNHAPPASVAPPPRAPE